MGRVQSSLIAQDHLALPPQDNNEWIS